MKTRVLGVPIAAILVLALPVMPFCLSNVALADEDGAHTHEHGTGLSWFSLVRPLGISALTCVLVTFGTGLFRRRLRTRFLKVHRVFAWLAVGLGLVHGILVLALFGT
ncbi:MAG: hypothetical protein P8Z79_05280 [Sedimentisphaerales bacterium]|jgi:hypothetical protein